MAMACEEAEKGKEDEKAKTAARKGTEGLAGRLVEQMRGAVEEWIALMDEEDAKKTATPQSETLAK